MKLVLSIVALLFALSAFAEELPTKEKCKQDPKTAGCERVK